MTSIAKKLLQEKYFNRGFYGAIRALELARMFAAAQELRNVAVEAEIDLLEGAEAEVELAGEL